MIRSESSSNNEDDESPSLLSGKMQLTLARGKDEFVLDPTEVVCALNVPFTLFEDQALKYFGGYVMRKMMSYHGKKDCDVCSKLGHKMSKGTCDIPNSDFFTWLKCYDDESRASLYIPGEDFSMFVRKTCLIVQYCFYKYLSKDQIMSSMNTQVIRYICMPQFCTVHIQKKVVAVIIKTLFLHKVKWFNNDIKNTQKSSQRKLSILKHV